MKLALLLASTALAVSLVVLVSVLTDPDPVAGGGGSLSPTSLAPEAVARIESLEEENRLLRDKVAMLESEVMSRLVALETGAPDSDSGRSPLGGYVSQAEFDALREALEKALSNEEVFSATSPAFKERVADTLVDIQREKAAVKSREGLEKRTSSLREQMPAIAEKLGLSYGQQTELQDLLEDHYARTARYSEMVAEGVPLEQVGEQKGADWQHLNDSLSGILTPEQLESYRGMRGRETGWLLPGSGGGK